MNVQAAKAALGELEHVARELGLSASSVVVRSFDAGMKLGVGITLANGRRHAEKTRAGPGWSERVLPALRSWMEGDGQ